MQILRVLPKDLVLPLHHGDTILAAISRGGLSYLVGCRRGGCGICKADLITGQVSYPVPVSETVLTPAERAERVVLTCRAVPGADCTVQLRSQLRVAAPFLFDIAQRELVGHHDQKGAD
jgi:CDP-4-dehydro-6-deoxyglucose reductase